MIKYFLSLVLLFMAPAIFCSEFDHYFFRVQLIRCEYAMNGLQQLNAKKSYKFLESIENLFYSKKTDFSEFIENCHYIYDLGVLKPYIEKNEQRGCAIFETALVESKNDTVQLQVFIDKNNDLVIDLITYFESENKYFYTWRKFFGRFTNTEETASMDPI